MSYLFIFLSLILHIEGMLLASLMPGLGLAQEGYDYAPPPASEQLRPQTQGGSKPQAQGHSHSGDPLDWLRESVPGKDINILPVPKGGLGLVLAPFYVIHYLTQMRQQLDYKFHKRV